MFFQHWSPVGNRKGNNTNISGDDEDDEDKDLSTYDPIAAFANPIQRKEKKGLDLGRWRELLNDDNSPPPHTTKRREKGGAAIRNDMEKCMSSDVSSVSVNESAQIEMDVEDSCELVKDDSAEPVSSAVDMDVDNLTKKGQLENNENASSSGLMDKTENMSLSSELGGEAMTLNCRSNEELQNKKNMDCVLPERIKQQELRPSTLSKFPGGSENIDNQGSSLESQIDAENHARLMSMSHDEIVQAQAEIMEKIDPEVLKLLRNRALEKLKKKKTTGSFTKENENQVSMTENDASNFKSEISHTVTTASSNETQRVLDKCNVQSSDTVSDNLWSLWSKRVEAIRELRFSLDGDVVRNDTGTGKPSITILI